VTYSSFGKRALDVFLAAAGLVLLAPLLVLSAILIRVSSPGPVLYVQDRMGKSGQVFRIFKLRTMVDRARIPDDEVFSDSPELTSIGRWLRRFKIDEVPQLANVLRGDLSLVGPRPALPAQLGDYTELAYRRLTVTPGLTGLAQVSGNIYLSWEDRWRYDARYIESISLSSDLRIMWKTAQIVLLGEERFVLDPELRHCGGKLK